MIEKLIEWSVRRPWWVVCAALALTLAGIYAFRHTPIDAIPDLSENQLIVFTDWIGHNPQEIEDEITYPLSLRLQAVAGLRVVRSDSEVGFSMIHMIFEDHVDVTAARREVAQRLADSVGVLPSGVTPRMGPDAQATGQIYWYTVEGSGLDLGKLRAIQDWYVRPQLSAVPGVAEVASVGGRVAEYQVTVDPARLRTYHVTVGDVMKAVTGANRAVGGDVIEKGNAEYVIRGSGRLGDSGDTPAASTHPRVNRRLEGLVVVGADGFVRLGDVAHISLGPQPRRGILEKDGNEVVGGVILMARGENPLEVTARIRDKIRDLQEGLPKETRIVPMYDRTPLIQQAIGTMSGALLEAILTAAICVLLILRHARTSFVVALTLPLAVLASFVIMWILRKLGVVDIQTNVMSLAGIAISIGVLVDSSIVMAENVMVHLQRHFGDRPVRGDIRAVVIPACRTVGRPIFFSVMIMLLSFLPIFFLGGIEGRMFRPLAFTKSFALVAVALLSITLVPALCTIVIKGRLRSERENWLVRSVASVYEPMLRYCLARPTLLIWFVAGVLLVGIGLSRNYMAAWLGSSVERAAFLAVLGLALVSCAAVARTWPGRAGALVSLIVLALVADRNLPPIGSGPIVPLDEGVVMDMPISWPSVSGQQAGDDLKARDMILCRFPEVHMVVGKAGRAETATDPAPINMIETMIDFRPRDQWPRRKLRPADARSHAGLILDTLAARGLIEPPTDGAALHAVLDKVLAATVPVFDALMREYCYEENRNFEREVLATSPGYLASSHHEEDGASPRLWDAHVQQLNSALIQRASGTFTRLAIEDLLARSVIRDPTLAAGLAQLRKMRAQGTHEHAGHHHDMAMMTGRSLSDVFDPLSPIDAVQTELTQRLAAGLLLWRKDRADLIGQGGELDQVMQMPGWTNVWTMPIQNRVDMLATGVNTQIGVRVLGRNLADVVTASEHVAAVLKTVPGATGVVADPVRGKDYLDIRTRWDRAAELGVSATDINDLVEIGLAGKVATTIVEGRERYSVRVRFPRNSRRDEGTVGSLQVAAHAKSAQSEGAGRLQTVPLSEVAHLAITPGPANIKSENGLLRNYVYLNVQKRDTEDFLAEAQRVVAAKVQLPEGVHLEWTGQFEHENRARNILLFVLPMVILGVFGLLYWTYRDLADAFLMLLAVPGALAGGILCQWLFGYKFSVTLWVGYIACFGMATATGIVMLVYLREAMDSAGGLARMTAVQLREAVMAGAVHRLRPKLLTECTTVIGLAPLLWATGTGAEIIKPMVVPVLGGLLLADEVIDLLLPVLFYHVRHWRWKRLHVAALGARGERVSGDPVDPHWSPFHSS